MAHKSRLKIRCCPLYNREEFHTMADPVYWDDAYPIALMLNAAHADVDDPSTITLSTLQAWVVALDGFADDGDAPQPEWLEHIQAEWVELK